MHLTLFKVGVVDQEPVLFDGSIADNIRYGVPEASDEDVRDAAQQVTPSIVRRECNNRVIIFQQLRFVVSY